jgi:hypothetical protein
MRSECLPDDAKIQRYVDLVNSNRRAGKPQGRSDNTLSESRQGWIEVRDKYSGSTLDRLQQMVEFKKQDAGKMWSNTPDYALENSMGEQFQIQILECLVAQRMSAAKR